MKKYRIYEQDMNGFTKRIDLNCFPGEWKNLINIDYNYAVATYVRGEWILIHDDVFFNWDAAQKEHEEIKQIVDYVGITI